MSEVAELLERFRRGGELLASLTTGAAGAELDFQANADLWSVRQIVCHLMDTELVAHGRLSALIAEENPTLVAFDGAAWTANLNYRQRKFSGAVELYRRMIAENYDLLKEQPESVWSRQGTHTETGPITLLQFFREHIQHAEDHLMEVREIRQKYKASKQTGAGA
ncbi:DinB family protein [Bryobacter aggregatus]|uniref:DinB family protein n=1 Tax=Bryobacter aggregatus TaxID=360054 RepID=UPI0004E1C0E5|nr:DinB family protein [Bryobacter aggregatus]